MVMGTESPGQGDGMVHGRCSPPPGWEQAFRSQKVGVEVRTALRGLVPRGDGQTPKWAPQTEVSAGVSQNPPKHHI